jgi:hypothetical protein
MTEQRMSKPTRKPAPNPKPLGQVSPPVTNDLGMRTRLKEGRAQVKKIREAELKTPGVIRKGP